jgi:hypothetical protein
MRAWRATTRRAASNPRSSGVSCGAPLAGAVAALAALCSACGGARAVGYGGTAVAVSTAGPSQVDAAQSLILQCQSPEKNNTDLCLLTAAQHAVASETRAAIAAALERRRQETTPNPEAGCALGPVFLLLDRLQEAEDAFAVCDKLPTGDAVRQASDAAHRGSGGEDAIAIAHKARPAELTVSFPAGLKWLGARNQDGENVYFRNDDGAAAVHIHIWLRPGPWTLVVKWSDGDDREVPVSVDATSEAVIGFGTADLLLPGSASASVSVDCVDKDCLEHRQVKLSGPKTTVHLLTGRYDIKVAEAPGYAIPEGEQVTVGDSARVSVPIALAPPPPPPRRARTWTVQLGGEGTGVWAPWGGAAMLRGDWRGPFGWGVIRLEARYLSHAKQDPTDTAGSRVSGALGFGGAWRPADNWTLSAVIGPSFWEAQGTWVGGRTSATIEWTPDALATPNSTFGFWAGPSFEYYPEKLPQPFVRYIAAASVGMLWGTAR